MPAGAPPKPPPLVRFQGISKRFDRLWANRDITFDVRQGEIHALVGENGAGKSTLMGLLYGHWRPDAGTIRMAGSPVRFARPRDAIRAGIGMVHQQLLIFPQLSSLENIVIGQEPGRFGRVDRAEARDRITALCLEFNFAMELDRPARDLSYAHRQQIELLRLLARDAKVLVLDEPTTLLTEPEIEQLFRLLREFREKGRTIVFVSHRLREVFALADRVSVLRRGRHQATRAIGETSPDEVAAWILGLSGAAARARSRVRVRQQPTSRTLSASDGVAAARLVQAVRSDPLLELDRASTKALGQEAGLDRVSIRCHAGEIIGFGGVVGNGLRSLARTLAGLVPVQSGRIVVDGVDGTDDSVRDRSRRGIRWLPANPDEEALMPLRPIWENALLGHQRDASFQHFGRLDAARIRHWVRRQLDRMEVACGSLADSIRTLSGGNRQKVVLGRILAGSLRLGVLEQPTRGLDIQARQSCYDRIREMSRTGVSFVICSYDLDELFQICHRVGILYRGRLMGMEPVAELDRNTVARWMLG